MVAGARRAVLGRLLLGLLLCCGLHETCAASVPTYINTSDPVQLAEYYVSAAQPSTSNIERPLGCKCLPAWEVVVAPSGTRCRTEL